MIYMEKNLYGIKDYTSPNRLMRAIAAGWHRVVQPIVVFTTWLARCCMCEGNQKNSKKEDQKMKKTKTTKKYQKRKTKKTKPPLRGKKNSIVNQAWDLGKKGVEPV